MADYGSIPAGAKLKPIQFRANIPQQQLDDFRSRLEQSPVAPQTWENAHDNGGSIGTFGVSHKWMTETKEYWLKNYDWRETEDLINDFPNYVTAIKDEERNTLNIHFIGLFSKRKDAIPIVFLHGWPGSFLEFLDVLHHLTEKYSADDLPYHVVVPSLPGYAYSSGPPISKQWGCEETADIINKLMVGLGFEKGYISQGGDIGSRVARILCTQYEACKSMHLNFSWIPPPEGVDAKDITEQEQKGLDRGEYFSKFGFSYAREHGMRSATIGLVLSSSPIALLAWIGEKFLDWSDTNPSLHGILDSVTLYWLTSTISRSLYPYVQESGDVPSQKLGEIHAQARYHCKKPFGYSYFPMDLFPMPVSWVKTTGNLTWYRRHEHGGHFAAMEKPKEFLQDIEDFVAQLDKW